VSVYTTHLYTEQGSSASEVNGMRQDIKAVDNKVERFEHGAKEALTQLSNRLDDVEEDRKELRKEVKDVQSQFTSFQQEANSQFDHLRC
jgi:chromosome segregation ATPase